MHVHAYAASHECSSSPSYSSSTLSDGGWGVFDLDSHYILHKTVVIVFVVIISHIVNNYYHNLKNEPIHLMLFLLNVFMT